MYRDIRRLLGSDKQALRAAPKPTAAWRRSSCRFGLFEAAGEYY